MKSGFLKSVLIVGAFMVATAPSFAQTTFTLSSAVNGENVDITPSAGIGTEGTYAGDYDASLVTGQTKITTPIYCIDPWNQINWGGTYTATTTNLATSSTNGLSTIKYVADGGGTTNSPISQAAADEVSYLAYNYLGVTTFTNAVSTDANVNQAAIQLAIWDIIDPAGTYLNTTEDSAFGANGSLIEQLTQDYVNGAKADGSTFTSSQVYLIQQAGVTTPTTQEFIYDNRTPGGTPVIPGGGLPPTPEPSITAFGISLVAALSIMMLMKRRSTVTA